MVREAVLRELKRGGQVYYLHNDVESIEKCAADLAELVPEARIGIAHGQMRERELERVMSDFYHQRFNLLVCTTIIETGIDVPSANTIIMDRADHLAWPSCTSCGAGSAALTTRPMPICSPPIPS